MSENKSTANASVNAKMGLLGWLTLLFVILKLNPGGYLDSPVEGWSWWLVLSPILAIWAILLIILAGVGVVFGVAWLLDKREEKRRKKDMKAVQNMTPGERREYFANKRKR